MRALFCCLLTATLARAAIDGTVTNATTSKPQPGATVTLFQTSQQGPHDLGSVKSDAQGKFVFTQDVQPGVGGGPLLLQAVYDGVQYNKMLPPGSSTSGVEIPVYQSLKTPGQAKVQQHMVVLEPSSQGSVQVTESYVLENGGNTTWNDPDRGTLQFAFPAAAQGKVEVNVLAPGGLPIRRALDPTGKPDNFKLDFPIKPGQSQVDLSWSMPFNSPGNFEEHVPAKAELTRLVAPAGVQFKGPGVNLIGQEPSTKANIYEVKGPDIQIRVEGTGLFNAPSDSSQAGGGGQSNGPSLSENLPKLYGLELGSSGLLHTLLAVKWVLLTVLGMLALAFVLLYRKGNPLETAADAAPDVKTESGTAAGASTRHARTRG